MNLTKRAQVALADNLTLEDALPAEMPVYVNSSSYMFGVATLSSLTFIIVTGLILSLFGPNWYHVSRTGLFFNSLHFWSVQIFFLALVLHLVTKYLIASWRDGRAKTWIWGVLALGLAVVTGLTGFLSQGNWDSQWIAVQAKDAFNALGVGALFNTLNVSQVLTLHVFALPLILGIIVLIHLFFVRSDGPVKPLQRRTTR